MARQPISNDGAAPAQGNPGQVAPNKIRLNPPSLLGQLSAEQ